MMGSEKNYDDLLYPLLCSEGNIVGFFDRIFEFLYRRTDFFKLKHDESPSLGLKHGEAEKIVRSVFCKYMEQATSEQEPPNVNDSPDLDFIAEEVVTTSELETKSPSNSECIENKKIDLKKDHEQTDDQIEPKIRVMDPDCYNGAHYEGYSWAQTVKDIDVHIQVPNTITTGKQVRVNIEQSHLKAEVRNGDQWEVFKDGDLSWKINVEESTWTLVPGEHIHICLQKIQEKWWEAFFVDEPKIDLKSIDPSIPYEDLDPESQAKIEELMYNERLKRLGKPTIQESKVHKILKDAWNCEGSPFKGQPFDPSIVNVQNSENI